jgi:hypothetical protein
VVFAVSHRPPAFRFMSTMIIAPGVSAVCCVSSAALRYVEPPVERDLLIDARVAELKARRLAAAG